MRTSCCWSYQPGPPLRRSQLWLGPKSDRAIGMMTKGKLMRQTDTLKQVHFSVVMSGSLQLPHTDSKGNGEAGKGVTLSPSSDPAASQEFCLDDIWGPCIPVRGLPFPHFGPSAYMATQVWGLHASPCACWASTRPPVANLHDTSCHIWRVTPRSLSCANLPKEPECLFHRSPHHPTFGEVTPANQVSLVVLLTETLGGSTHCPQKGWILEELKLQGLGEWPEAV